MYLFEPNIQQTTNTTENHTSPTRHFSCDLESKILGISLQSELHLKINEIELIINGNSNDELESLGSRWEQFELK